MVVSFLPPARLRGWLLGCAVALMSLVTPNVWAQTWPWAARTSGTGHAMFSNVTVDAAGNAYVVGRFFGTISCGTTTLTSPGSEWDVLVGKLSPAGQWLWAKRAGRAGSNDIGYGIGVDRSGNVYVGGHLSAGTYAFDQLPLTITSVGCATYAFVGKLSASGQWQWVKGAGTGSLVYDLVVDPSNNVCVVGLTRSVGTFNATVGPPPYGNYAFATKLSPTGAVLWNAEALVEGGAQAVAVDRSGNFYLGGDYSGTRTVGTTNLASFGRHDGFIAKLSSAGQWQWAQRLGSTGEDGVTDVAVDAAGNTYATSSINGRATIGTTTFAATASGGYGAIAKCGPTGQWLWAVRPETPTSADSQWPTSVTIDAAGSLHVLGTCSGTVQFGATSLTTSAYLARLNATTGAWQWAQGLGLGSSYGAIQGLAAGPAGALWLGAYYATGFRLGSITLPTGANSNNTGLVAKLSFAAPTLSSLSPASGAVGSTVTINGMGLNATTAVKFGTRVASYTVVSATRLTVTVPAGAITAPITVTTSGGPATSATAFTVVPPALNSFSPAGGPVGTLVTINGTGFTGATGVKFNGLAAASFTVVSGTQIKATVPAGAITGKISVLAPGGTKASATNFTVTAARPATMSVAAPDPVAEPALELYPNPATTRVHLTLPAGVRTVEIFDANSLPVRSVLVDAGATEAELSVDGLRRGTYMVRCGRAMRRLVVE